jgi:hypothetical protein
MGERHLRSVVMEYLNHYHMEGNHQGLGNKLIEPSWQIDRGRMACRERWAVYSGTTTDGQHDRGWVLAYCGIAPEIDRIYSLSAVSSSPVSRCMIIRTTLPRSSSSNVMKFRLDEYRSVSGDAAYASMRLPSLR